MREYENIRDDRTVEECAVYTEYVIAHDKFLSGKLAKYSYAAWACKPEDTEECYNWVEGRCDMTRVKIVDDMPKAIVGKPDVDIHIYKYQKREA